MKNVGVLDRGRPEVPLFRDCDECEFFVQYLLSDEAMRSPARKTKHQNRSLEAIHSGIPVRCGLRGSDRPGRIFVCITVMRLMGITLKSACVLVAGLLETELGKSRRGLPSGSQRTEELINKAETVRSVFNSLEKRATPIDFALHLSSFRSWRAWAVASDEDTLEFFTEKFEKERGVQATKRWRTAIEDLRKKYSGYKDQIEKRWADVLQRFAILPEAEQALREPHSTRVEAVLAAAMTGDGAIAAFRDEDFLYTSSAWASLLTSKWIEENPSDPSVAALSKWIEENCAQGRALA
jgi:hypothetical protein